MPIVRINGLNKRGVNCLTKDFRNDWIGMKFYQQSQKKQSRKPNNQSN